MSEENQPQPVPEPTQDAVVVPPTPPTVKPKPSGDWKGRHGALEALPLEVKKDMEDAMRRTNPYQAKKFMIEKHGEKFPVLKEMSKAAFYQYWKRHNVQVARELELQKQAAEIAPELKEVINKFTDPDISLSDKRVALNALFNSCEARSKLLQERQTNFIDPALEALILANRKEQRIIIEKVAVLNAQLSSESSQDWLGEASNLVQVILSAVYNSYRLVHTDQSNFSMFSSTLGENLNSILKNYKSAKEQLKKETK
jgi:hypothetical protein